MNRIITFLIFVLTLTSCKSTRVSDKSIEYLPARSVVKKNTEARFGEHSVKASMNVKYKGKEELPNLKASLRMVKDSVIWINFSKLGFPVAKLKITPLEVRFYDKIGKRSFEGNFELISRWLGTDFDFDKIQNLFLGEALIDLETQKHKVSVTKRQYELHSKKRNPVFDIIYWINPVHFKVMKEELRGNERDQNLTIKYKDFHKINESLFPKGMLITARDRNLTTIIEVTYKNVQFDLPLKFPFQIPAGYRNIELE